MRLLIKEFWQRRGMTQMKLAAKLGYTSTGTISKLERGYYSPTVAELEKIAAALGVPATALIAVEESTDAQQTSLR